MTYTDDNFGHWDMEDPDSIEFYHQVQAESTWKRCEGCGELVKLRPQYGFCNDCATKMEQGWDMDTPDPIDEAVDLELQVRRAEQKVEDEIRKRKLAEVEIEDEYLLSDERERFE